MAKLEIIETEDIEIDVIPRVDSRRISIDKIKTKKTNPSVGSFLEVLEHTKSNYLSGSFTGYRMCVEVPNNPNDRNVSSLEHALVELNFVKEVTGLYGFTQEENLIPANIWGLLPGSNPVEMERERSRVMRIITDYRPVEIEPQKKKFLESLSRRILTKDNYTDKHILKLLEILHERFGEKGEKWYDSSEISPDWIKNSIKGGSYFIYVCDGDSCVGAASYIRAEESIFNVDILGYKPNLNFLELSHFAVTPRKQGKYAGLAAIMNRELMNNIDSSLNLVHDANWNRKHEDGGGAWKLGPKFGWYPCLGICLYYTGMMADPKRADYTGNNHLVFYQKFSQNL